MDSTDIELWELVKSGEARIRVYKYSSNKDATYAYVAKNIHELHPKHRMVLDLLLASDSKYIHGVGRVRPEQTATGVCALLCIVPRRLRKRNS